MKTWVRKTLSVGVLAAGALLFAPGAAQADVDQNSSDNNGILNGTQLVAPISVPVNVVGNAIGVAGEANAAGAGANWVAESGRGVDQNSSDNNGILNGTQIAAPVDLPINVCGNALGILGEANAAASCSNGGNGGNGGDNGGNNGDDDDEYKPGNGQNDGDDADADDYGHHPRNAHKVTAKSATEKSPVAGLTQGLGGLGLLNTLR
jgi:ChpA-C